MMVYDDNGMKKKVEDNQIYTKEKVTASRTRRFNVHNLPTPTIRQTCILSRKKMKHLKLVDSVC